MKPTNDDMSRMLSLEIGHVAKDYELLMNATIICDADISGYVITPRRISKTARLLLIPTIHDQI